MPATTGRLMEKIFDENAKLIWLPTPQRAKNSYACFRRRFTANGRTIPANVRITADSRYELYINGVWVGHGPPRAFANPWPIDEYDVAHLLRDGDNVIAVLVHHFGISTFQYLHEDPGLLAQLTFADTPNSPRSTTARDAHRRRSSRARVACGLFTGS